MIHIDIFIFSSVCTPSSTGGMANLSGMAREGEEGENMNVGGN